ncbi:MAG TPA: hypothetical protein DC038_05155 [Clostridiales bacterium]|nr:hypothetical protein [Clostridiales bacterium]
MYYPSVPKKTATLCIYGELNKIVFLQGMCLVRIADRKIKLNSSIARRFFGCRQKTSKAERLPHKIQDEG